MMIGWGLCLQVHSIYKHHSIGNAITIVVVKILVLESKEVSVTSNTNLKKNIKKKNTNLIVHHVDLKLDSCIWKPIWNQFLLLLKHFLDICRIDQRIQMWFWSHSESCFARLHAQYSHQTQEDVHQLGWIW